MASYHDLLDAIARIRSVTGDREAWTKGLTGDDVSTACNPASPPAALGAVLAKLTAAHPDVFLSPVPAGPQSPLPRVGEGAAADAIRDAETALAQQNTEAAHVDLQVVTAVLNAHAAHGDGLAELVALQRDIEGAVASRTDLDTPAGAREFQRYLIGKLREIRNVVENAGLDATSRASVAAALATLYASAQPDPRDTDPPAEGKPVPGPEPSDANGGRREPAQTASGTPPCVQPFPPLDPGTASSPPTDAVDPLAYEPVWDLPSLPGDPPDDPAAPVAAPPPPPVSAPVMPAPAMPTPPWNGGFPAAAPLGGFPPLAGPQAAPLADLPRADLPERTRARSSQPDPLDPPDPVDLSTPPADDRTEEPPTADGNVVELPDGDTVTAPTPELAAAITAAVGGVPIPEAFRLQGIALPPAGSVVPAPLDPALLIPGDIGLLTDRHALALGNGKALLDQRIQPIAGVTGPGFLGWQHPPEPETTDATPEVPAPNRAAATAPS